MRTALSFLMSCAAVFAQTTFNQPIAAPGYTSTSTDPGFVDIPMGNSLQLPDRPGVARISGNLGNGRIGCRMIDGADCMPLAGNSGSTVTTGNPNPVTAGPDFDGFSNLNSWMRAGKIEFSSFDDGTGTFSNNWFCSHCYYDGAAGTFRTRTAGATTLFYMQDDEGQFRFAPAASPGAAITPTTGFKMTRSGQVCAGSAISTQSGSCAGASFIASPAGFLYSKPAQLLSDIGSLCDASHRGATASILDADTPVIGEAVNGGGGAFAYLVCNGLAWTVIGK